MNNWGVRRRSCVGWPDAESANCRTFGEDLLSECNIFLLPTGWILRIEVDGRGTLRPPGRPSSKPNTPPMTNKSVAQICAIAAVVALPTLSWAGTSAKDAQGVKAAPAPQKLQESAITGDIGVNVVTSYYSRGIIQNNHSASYQPYADIFLKTYEGDGLLNKVVLNASIWDSFSNPATWPKNYATATKAAPTTKSWYESDFTPGIALTFGKVTLTETYLFYFSPNDQFDTFEGLNSKLAYDDSDLLGAFALHPSVTYLKELVGNGGTNSRKGGYWEAAVAPGFSAGPVAVTVPITAGFGTSKFYDKDGYGYLSAGLNLAYTLPVSKSYGTWTANVGGTYYNINRSAAGGTMSNDVVGSAGIAVAF